MSNYYKIGYVNSGFLSQVTPEDMQILTHINIAFGLVENGRIKINHLKNTDYIRKLRQYNPKVKILLSVGGWGAGGFSAAASTLEGCINFAESAYEAVASLELDGIDIDWEYPCSNSAGIDASPYDKFNFTVMIQKLREFLPDWAMLTIAAGAGQYYADCAEMDRVQKYLDYVQLMTYDMCGGDTVTLHHTNLYTSNEDIDYFCVDYAVDIFKNAGVPSDKLIIGAAFYSRDWKNVSEPHGDGLYQPVGVSAGFGPVFTDLYNNYINQNGYKRYWDDIAKAPYLFNGSHFITYDDEESVAYKCAYVKEKGLKGIMYWEHSCDKGRRLLDVIRRYL